MDRMSIKTKEEIAIMGEGGKMLAFVREEIARAVKPGVTGLQLEEIACELIEKTGGKPSFKMVSGYRHATCININDVVVHGIPNNHIIANGDKVGIDVGLFWKGFHTDTSVTVTAGEESIEIKKFLDTGKRALKKAIEQARPGKRIADISRAMQETVENEGYGIVTALTGHGIGKNLHEEPAIPCFVYDEDEHTPLLKEDMVIAIEVMYNQGTGEVAYKNNDGWTIVTADGKISGLFEHTVAVTRNGPLVLTA
jgi:methionyl aminopeptidase